MDKEKKDLNGFRLSCFVHGEAYCLMFYECDEGCCHELIWNSRDGVTPFVISSRRGHQMMHTNWGLDVCIPEHKPCRGERIFVDATEKLVAPKARLHVDLFWNPRAGHKMMQETFKTKDEAVKFFIKDWTKPGSPWLLEVEENVK